MLDTTVLIDAERSPIDLDALIADDDQPAVAVITIAELAVGVEISAASVARRDERSSPTSWQVFRSSATTSMAPEPIQV